jgi:signal transduction histidine kinase
MRGRGPAGRWAQSRLGCYLRARLQRRLFLWFGLAILLSMLTGGAAMYAVSAMGGRSPWMDMARVQRFVGGRFAEVWDAPRARDALGRDIAEEFDLGVSIAEPSGVRIAAYGRPCARSWFSVPVVREGQKVGVVNICTERPHGGGPPRFLAAVFVAGLFLWILSGAVARRLTRPLEELARVAGDIGRGVYSARVRLGRHGHGEAQVLAEAMNDMAARIERQVTDQRELLAAVSHELRTPLGHMRLLTELARDGVNVEKSFDQLDREVMEMDALVGDLLASSRIDFKALSKDRIDAVEAGRRALERAGLEDDKLIVTGEREPGMIEADATLLGRALANLLDNAKKHGGGVLALRIEAGDGVVSFEVEDDGRGLGAGEEARIFEPFYRRPDEKAREQGSLGLGLSLVQRIAEAHGGRTRASNRAEGGARIGMELPVG